MTLTFDPRPGSQAQVAPEVLSHQVGFDGIAALAPPHAPAESNIL